MATPQNPPPNPPNPPTPGGAQSTSGGTSNAAGNAAALAAQTAAAQAATNATAAGSAFNNPPGPILAWIDNDDLNGECFLAGEVGEREEVRNNRKVGFFSHTPRATTPGMAVDISNAQASDFIALNVRMLADAYQEAPKLLHFQIAYVRFLAVRAGLISPAFRPADYNVRYNEAEQVTQLKYAQLQNAYPNTALLSVGFSAGARKTLRENFANMVCAVAYMFRVRGHHHLAEMDNKYKALWKKCLKEEDTPGFDWQFVAHDALHAIIPIVLDNYWQAMKDAGRIAGALVKRFDSAPAGVAAVRAVYAGAQDLQMAVPGIRDRFRGHFDDLDGLIDKMRLERWAGSINRRYYNAGNIDFDEQKFGAIASVVYHALNAFANNSQLLKSNALIRVANNAPITGGIVSRSIATAASDPALVKAMLNIDNAVNN